MSEKGQVWGTVLQDPDPNGFEYVPSDRPKILECRWCGRTFKANYWRIGSAATNTAMRVCGLDCRLTWSQSRAQELRAEGLPLLHYGETKMRCNICGRERKSLSAHLGREHGVHTAGLSLSELQLLIGLRQGQRMACGATRRKSSLNAIARGFGDPKDLKGLSEAASSKQRELAARGVTAAVERSIKSIEATPRSLLNMHEKICQKISARRAAVEELKGRSLPTAEIARQLSVSLATVRNDIRYFASFD